MAPAAERRLSLQLQGLVQGVGFRPWAHRQAAALELRGWVRNGADGVELELEGPQARLDAFLEQLRLAPPPRCRLDRISARWDAASGATGGATEGFTIRDPERAHASPAAGALASALISPDLAICGACLAELADPGNRRHGYPFISCTDCGPRYSVLRQLPFERAHTSLAAFALCSACRREYRDPSDRRFHAQTLSCPHCGPRLRWQPTATTASEPTPNADPQAAIAAAAACLQRGGIVALQGIGGFQLLVDPHNAGAVAELRSRKGRPDKPLALLATPQGLQQSCRVSPEEEALWWSPAAPILLLPRREPAAGRSPLAAGVAGASPWLGVMRPASGLHQLLLQASGFELLVATSANRSGEPIVCDGEADGAVLAQLADGVLLHDLPIVNRIDDSVCRWAANRPLVLRLGRGLAPLALIQPARRSSADTRLALGAQLKGSLALQLPGLLLLSPELGDLSSSRGAQLLHDTATSWLQRHGATPSAIACDQHPAYSSSQLAAEWAQMAGLPLHRVQHHHAHLLTVMAEHGLEGEAVGVAWDGAGRGDDGSLWGGEALAVSPGGYRRLARLRPFRLPGGERAMREPRRVALALLWEAFGEGWRGRVPCCGPEPWAEAFSTEELLALEHTLRQGPPAPLCSSVGRLFDGVAALLGLVQRCSFEAQAALALEGLAEGAGGQACPRYCLALRAGPGLLEWDWQPLLQALLNDLRDPGLQAGALALAVHRALACAIRDLALHQREPRQPKPGHGPDPNGTVLLSGGCFQNRLLLELTVAELRQHGLTPLWPEHLPSNDAALPVGQLLARTCQPHQPSL